MPTSYPHLLLVYPEFPKTYWGMQYSLPLFGKKALMPPLGLLTIAAMTPPDYEARLVDLNCAPLTDDDLAWADMVCFSAMLPQKRSLFDTASRPRQQTSHGALEPNSPVALPPRARMQRSPLVRTSAAKALLHVDARA
jgi:hypothetical protein